MNEPDKDIEPPTAPVATSSLGYLVTRFDVTRQTLDGHWLNLDGDLGLLHFLAHGVAHGHRARAAVLPLPEISMLRVKIRLWTVTLVICDQNSTTRCQILLGLLRFKP